MLYKFRMLLFITIILYLACQSDSGPVSNDDNEPTLTYQMVWSDEFEGSSLDRAKWRYETGAHGWGNNEWQNYTAGDNVRVEDGYLYIIAEKTGNGQSPGDYTSTRLNSIESWTYGRFEIRAKMPEWKGNGLWPAIWMLGKNINQIGWPKCGEIDIMEYVSYTPDHVVQTIHSIANNHINGTQISSGYVSLENMEEEFHTYGITWEKDSLKFYVDDINNVNLTIPAPAVKTQDNWPFGNPFYLLLNMAVGGNWGGVEGVDDSIFPSEFVIDYVRVYQLKEE